MGRGDRASPRRWPTSAGMTVWVASVEALPRFNDSGTPGRTRTCDPRLRRPLLYPAELRALALTAHEPYTLSLRSWGRSRPCATLPALVAHPPPDRLASALDDAVRGRRQGLQDLLARGSHLPGTRMNRELADAFAQSCRVRGASADPVVLALARLSADEAPGATALEFLPVCGLHAIGARAAADPNVRASFLAELHAHADDLRFRVRDAVVLALSRVGQSAGDALVRDVGPWMDGYFHAAAVVRALALGPWNGSLHDAEAVVLRLDEALSLAQGAPRAASRWPGHKELALALEGAVPAIAQRFGVPVFDMLVRWSAVQDAGLREAISRILGAERLGGRYRAEIDRVRHALDASRPAPRNPDHDVGPTRDRSRRRRQR
jgi:hypothetical protein